jgi:hypothetical protein
MAVTARFLGMATAIMLSGAFSMDAADPGSDELKRVRVLVPFDSGVVAGAFGSQWSVSFVSYNDSNEEVSLFPEECEWLGVKEPCEMVITAPPRTTTELDIVPGVGPLVLYIPEDQYSEIYFSLRVMEKSSGTILDVPVLPETELCVGTALLMNIPLSQATRLNLRLYSLDLIPGIFELSVIDPSTGHPVREEVLILPTPTDSVAPPLIPKIWDISAVVEKNKKEMAATVGSSVHIKIRRAFVPEAPFWALLSATDNSHRSFLVDAKCR